MVMGLDQHSPSAPVDILATDLDQRVLELARQAVYRKRSVRLLSPEWLERYFEALPGERWALKPEVAAKVSFRCLNLIDGQEIERLPHFDVIFCRNVLIYFREARISQLIQQLARLLTPGGWLIVGASESLLRYAPPLHFQERNGVVVYHKPLHE